MNVILDSRNRTISKENSQELFHMNSTLTI